MSLVACTRAFVFSVFLVAEIALRALRGRTLGVLGGLDRTHGAAERGDRHEAHEGILATENTEITKGWPQRALRFPVLSLHESLRVLCVLSG